MQRHHLFGTHRPVGRSVGAVREDGSVTALGVIFPPDRRPEQLRPVAEAADRAGLEQLWVWEDCFKESGIATAAAVLGWTQQLAVGIGLLPVPLRNVALTAMELATLERLFPGRVVPGIGHGVLDWMAQVGARADSPMTLLSEYTAALRHLLRGQRVTTTGDYVRLTDVALDWPPAPPPPLLVGARRGKTARLAGELGDGLILTGDTEPAAWAELLDNVADGRRAAGRSSDPAPLVVAFAAIDARLGAAEVAGRVADYARAGATHVPVLAVGDDDVDLADYARFLARDVRPLVP
jgi:alkanesulfonate monooxygenase SsuD/methylene tetrahydromethanopterin reductase-like flavin-dependent oxidoreductase (luciferase family)